MARDRAAILRHLGDVASELEAAKAGATELYALRLGLLQEGRALVPPITQRELAANARVSEEAIIQVLRKAARQQEAPTT